MLCTKGTNQSATFWNFWVLGSKITKFLSFSKKHIVFSSNSLLLFSIMGYNSSLLFSLKFYVVSTKGGYQSTKLVKFHLSSQKSEILHFDRLLLFKSYKVWAKNVQKSYYSWHWRAMQSLNENWPVVSTWHKEFGEFSPNHSKVWKFHLDELFLSKVFKVWAKKIQWSNLSWHWTVMQNLNKPWTMAYYIVNIVNIAGHAWTFGFKSSKRNWMNFY